MFGFGKKKLDSNNVDQMVSTANEIFEGVEIEEQDFEDQFDSHNKLDVPQDLVTNKDTFLSYGESCNKYDPCPICYKCRVKGSHLYNKCDDCPIPICIHTNQNREWLIKRDNFSLQVGKELVDILKEREQQLHSKK